MLPAEPAGTGRPLRRRPGNHKSTITMHTDAYLRLRAFAEQHGLTISGALHELVRTHPAIGLPSLLAPAYVGEGEQRRHGE